MSCLETRLWIDIRTHEWWSWEVSRGLLLNTGVHILTADTKLSCLCQKFPPDGFRVATCCRHQSLHFQGWVTASIGCVGQWWVNHGPRRYWYSPVHGFAYYFGISRPVSRGSLSLIRHKPEMRMDFLGSSTTHSFYLFPGVAWPVSSR